MKKDKNNNNKKGQGDNTVTGFRLTPSSFLLPVYCSPMGYAVLLVVERSGRRSLSLPEVRRPEENGASSVWVCESVCGGGGVRMMLVIKVAEQN